MILYFILIFFIMLLFIEVVKIFGFPLSGYEGEYSIEKSKVFRHLNLAADLKKIRFSNWIKQRKSNAKVITESELFMEHVIALREIVRENKMADMPETLIRDYLTRNDHFNIMQHHMKVMIDAYKEIENMLIIDLPSRIVLASDKIDAVGTKFSERDIGGDEMIRDFALISESKLSTLTKGLDMKIYKAIMQREKAIAMLSIHVLDYEIVNELFLTGMGLGHTGEVLIVNPEGLNIVPMKTSLVGGDIVNTMDMRIHSKAAMEALAGNEGIIEADDYRGVPVLAAYRYIRTSPYAGWAVIVKIDKTEVFAPFKSRMFNSLYVSLAGLFVAVLLILAISQRVTTPLLSLKKSLTEIAKGNFDREIKVTSNDEIGMLAHEFNEMRSKLSESYAGLEEMVKKRTSELEKANIKLSEVDRMKSMFIASVSHELRTPLNSIIGFTSVVLDGMSGEINPAQRDQLERVLRSAKHLLALISDVIDISKIESGEMNASVEDFSLRTLVNEAMDILHFQAKGKGIELNGELTNDIAMHTDRQRLLQCVMNCISNAVKYAEHGAVIVKAEEKNSNVEISVSDTGIGIPPRKIDEIFKPFERLQSHLTVRAGGTGLGLYLTKKLVTEILRGDISVESSEGKGSTFTLRLPKDIKQT